MSGDQEWIDSRGEGGEGGKGQGLEGQGPAPGQGPGALGKKGGPPRVMKVCVLPTAAGLLPGQALALGEGLASGQGLGQGLAPGQGSRGCVDVDVAVGVELVGVGLLANYGEASKGEGVGVGVGGRVSDGLVDSAVVLARRLMDEEEREDKGTGEGEGEGESEAALVSMSKAGSGSELESGLGLGLGLGVGSVAMIRARYTTHHPDRGGGSQIPSVLLQYLPMGGGRHPDTLPFDSTHCLWSLLDHMADVALVRQADCCDPAQGADASVKASVSAAVSALDNAPLVDAPVDRSVDTPAINTPVNTSVTVASTSADADTNLYTRSELVSALWEGLRVKEVTLWAGTNLVNGVQINYGLPLQHIQPPAIGQNEKNEKNEKNNKNEMNDKGKRLEIISPCLSSTHDDPIPHILSVGKANGSHTDTDDGGGEDEIVEVCVRAGE